MSPRFLSAMADAYRPGDRVRLRTLPPWVAELSEEGKAVFHACVGREFPVTEVLNGGVLVLDVSDPIDGQFGGVQNDLRVESYRVDPA